eukprot:m.143010 g.143010  ORF g.143010 m.143010 type:complete len:112 (+) comp14086_c0_seq2:609-944(+)
MAAASASSQGQRSSSVNGSPRPTNSTMTPYERATAGLCASVYRGARLDTHFSLVLNRVKIVSLKENCAELLCKQLCCGRLSRSTDAHDHHRFCRSRTLDRSFTLCPVVDSR